MSRCCICGREIDTPSPGILFVGTDGIERLLCDSCNAKADDLFEAFDRYVISSAANYFDAYIDELEDEEVRNFLLESLAERDFVHDDDSMDIPDISESRSGALLRSLAQLSFGISIIASCTLGYFVIRASDGVIPFGIIVAAVGIISAAIIYAFISVYLDMVRDIRIIKTEFLKSQYNK